MATETRRADGRSHRGPALAVITAIGVWAVIIGALVWLLAASHAQSRRVVIQRTSTRVQLGAEWSTLYVRDVLDREKIMGQTWLAGREVTPQRFARTMRGLGLPAAVLLDGGGRLLDVVPEDTALLGDMISRKYAHLAAAVAGHQAVSNVVHSAARADPVVAFATPYATPYGRRVLSGAYDVSKTPLGAYLGHLTVTPGHRVYLVDGSGAVIASSAKIGGGLQHLAQLDPKLAAAAAHHVSGAFSSRSGSQFFVTSTVKGTPWRLLMSVPEAQLFSAANSSVGLEWLVVIGFALAGLAVIALLARLARSRSVLAQINRELDRLAHIDSLTGVMTRRAITHSLEQVLGGAIRHEQDLSVLLVDIDHFKALNDTLGHHSGDLALTHTVHVLAATLRLEDVVGRWGGEEFLVVLPMTDAAGAQRVAERIRGAIEGAPPRIGDADWPLSVTVGVATWTGDSLDDLVARADAALYTGKNAGRNVVVLAPADEPAAAAAL